MKFQCRENWVIFKEIQGEENVTGAGIILVDPGTNEKDPSKALTRKTRGMVVSAGPEARLNPGDEIIYDPIQIKCLVNEGEFLFVMRATLVIAVVTPDTIIRPNGQIIH